MPATGSQTSAEPAFAEAGLRSCKRRWCAHFTLLEYKAERRSPSHSIGTSPTRLTASISAAGVGLAVATARGLTNDGRSVVFAAVPARRAHLATAEDIALVGSSIGVGASVAVFALSAIAVNILAGLSAAAWMVTSMATLIVLAMAVALVLPPARRRRLLLDRYLDSLEPAARVDDGVYLLEAFAASEGAPLLSLFRDLSVVADEHRIGLLAVAGNEKRMRVYTGRAGGFRVMFTDASARPGKTSRWYLARFPRPLDA